MACAPIKSQKRELIRGNPWDKLFCVARIFGMADERRNPVEITPGKSKKIFIFLTGKIIVTYLFEHKKDTNDS